MSKKIHKRGVRKELNGLLKVHTVDLVREKCDICGKEIYPSTMTTVISEWKFKYTCDECILKTGVIVKKELKEIKSNYISSKGNRYYLDTTWLDNDDLQETIKIFIELEKEDSSYVKNGDLWQMHYFLEGLSRGVIIFSESELYDYTNFYGNNPELVLLLRKLLFENKNNNFYKTTYISARTKKLSYKQLGALKRTKAFKNIVTDYDEFWEILPKVLEYILMSNESETKYKKIKNIVTNVIENEFFTRDQKKVIDSFTKENNIV